MVFCFSATGNSLWVARRLGRRFGMTPVMVDDAMKKGKLSFDVSASPFVAFVLPVHSWGPAGTMLEFIRSMNLEGAASKRVYGVFTCGADCGRADRVLSRELAARGICLEAVFSVIMPNSYILFPKVDVESGQEIRHKLDAAEERTARILDVLGGGRAVPGLYDSMRGAAFKTSVVNFGFRASLRMKSRFRVTENCTACGLCVRICPESAISARKDGRPSWGHNCVQCLACLNRCPEHAIEYGDVTVGKGRYVNPEGM